jgi:hypothetical protein
MQLGANAEQEAQFFETEVGVAQRPLARLAVRRFDQALEDVERHRRAGISGCAATCRASGSTRR